MRRIVFLAARVSFTLLVLACAVCAYADASLFRGSGNIGSVQTIDISGNSLGYFVSVEDVGSLLGFTSSRSGEELVLTRGNSKLRVMAKSAAAWKGISITPLYSEPFERNGKLWIDTQSAVSLFQAFAGAGLNNRLRFSKNSGALAQKVTPVIDVDYRTPNYEGNSPDIPVIAQIPVPKVQPKPQQVIASTVNTPAKMEEQAGDIEPMGQEVLLASSKTKTPEVSQKQPRLETFRPGAKKAEKGEAYSGTIRQIRWTHSEGTYNKVMAVIDTDDNADPQVYISGNNIHALFASCLKNAKGLSSPYENVKTELNKNSKGVELIFTLSDFTKAEKLVLNDPRRIAFDFFFSEDTRIARAGSSKPEATGIPRRQSPAVTTPPSTITIPMITGNIKRKTIVIDPGHGGKDPGAADNGVLEKNINLAVGLALERALTSKGYKVVMTRNTDVYLTLQERTDIANKENADLFVSVHVNALPNKKSMAGFEIYIMALPTDKDAMNLAKVENREYVEGKGLDVANVDRRTEMLLKILGDMQQNNKISESTDFAAALYNAGVLNSLPMRRIAQAPFFVLRGAGMPAVLLEIGFITNAAESALLATPNYQQKIAQAMSAGIMNYLK